MKWRLPQIITQQHITSGFTLVEILLYLAVVSVLLNGMVFFTQAMLKTRVKNQIIAEIDQTGPILMQRFLTIARSATSWSSPDAHTIMFTTPTGVKTVQATTSSLFIIVGGVNQPLLPNRILFSDFSFVPAFTTSTLSLLSFRFTLQYTMGSSTRQEYLYSRTFADSTIIPVHSSL